MSTSGRVSRNARGMFAPGNEKAMRRTGKVRALAMLITARLLKTASKKETDRTSPVASLTNTPDSLMIAIGRLSAPINKSAIPAL